MEMIAFHFEEAKMESLAKKLFYHDNDQQQFLHQLHLV